MNNILNLIVKKNHFFKYIFISFIFFTILNVNCAFTQNNNDKSHQSMVDPVQFLHSTIDEVLTELKKHHSTQKDINKIVDNFIMPKVDFNEMCIWITGRGIWAKSSQGEKSEFIKQLKILLIKSYSSTLKNYNEEKIEFQHYTGHLNNKRIQIKSTIIRPGKENISVDYRLIATTEGGWKVYDLIIEGVSVLQGFRAQFGNEIKLRGINFVIDKIKQHNKNNYKNNEK